MNQALAKKWTRELYFYQEQKGKEYYVHDFVINNHIDKNAEYVELYTEIYAKEREQPPEEKMSLGRKARYSLRNIWYYGIQRFASYPCFFSNTDTSAERVIYAVAKNEGSEGIDHGGYNAINAYDNVALSIGLFHWNRDKLRDLLYKYKKENEQNYNEYITKYGLTISESKLIEVDGFKVNIAQPEELRKLKIIYCFIKAAGDRDFQKVQKEFAEGWLSTVLEKRIRGKTIKDYITSEHGIALVLDVSVYKGPNSDLISEMVNHAIDKVLSKNIADTPANWNDAVEQDIINALNSFLDGNEDNQVPSRKNKINSANLNKKRNSFKQ
jgi:hypothetical protein